MDFAYYREYYDLERKHWWFRARSEIIESQIKLLAENRRLKILNIGTATGAGSEMLKHYGEVTSVEFDTDCVEFLRQQLKMEVTQASILELPFSDNSYDLVCAFDVIEHVADDTKAAREMKRVCKTGGSIFVTVPAYMFLWSEHDSVNHHERRYLAKEVKRLFSDTEVKFESYFNSILFLPVAIFRLASRLLPKKFLRKGAGSDFTLAGSGTFNVLFYQLFKLENTWLKRQAGMPFGISYLFIGKKTSEVQSSS